MKFLVFRYNDDEYASDILTEIKVDRDFLDEKEVLQWLPTITGSYTGMRYLIVRPLSKMVAVCGYGCP